MRAGKDSSFLRSLSLLRLCLSRLKADHAWGHTPYLSFSLLLSLQGLTATWAWAGTCSAGLDGDAKKKTKLNKTPEPFIANSTATHRDRCSGEFPYCIHLSPGEGGTAVWAELLAGHAFLPELHMPRVL